MRRGPLLLPLVLLVVVLGACATRTTTGAGGPGSAGDPDPAGSPVPPTSPGTAGTLPGPVTVVRSGGIAGLRDTVVVQPDGSWRRTAAVGRGRDSAGTLSAVQLRTLTVLAADPRLRAEAGHTATSTGCVDAFGYSVEVGTTTVRYVDCPGEGGQPVAAAGLARFLLAVSGG
jgi:hypothetical protein